MSPANDDNLFSVVVSGLCDNSTLVNSTLDCDIYLQCLDCTTNIVRNATLQECTLNVMFHDLPSGNYQIRRNISTTCGQHIIAGPEDLQIIGLHLCVIKTLCFHN